MTTLAHAAERAIVTMLGEIAEVNAPRVLIDANANALVYFDDDMDLEMITEIIEVLGALRANERIHTARFQHDGATYVLGDGDDLDAVSYYRGAFVIWCRKV